MIDVRFDEATDTFAIANLTLPQLNHILNCIAFAQDKGAVMPPDGFKPKKKGKMI